MGLSRKEMEEVIAGGGSVLHEGRLHTSLATLPSKAQLAQTDEDKAAAEGDLDKQIEALLAQKAALSGNKSTGAKAKDAGNKSTGAKAKDAGNKSTGADDKAEREKAFNALNRKNLDDLKKIAGDMKTEGYPVVDLADDATKEVIINAILDANEKGKGE